MEKNKKQGRMSRVLLGVFLYFAFTTIAALSEGGSGAAVGVVVLLALAAVVGLPLLRKAKTAIEREELSFRQKRETPAAQGRSFTAPEPHCLVCENTGEDHFARDRARRLAQLDAWLKNGIIDKAEYRILLQRYER